jgi:hypothetical protein
MVWHDKILKPLLTCRSINRLLSEKMQMPRLSPGDFAFCRAQLSLLQTHLTQLRRNQCPLSLTDAVEYNCQELSTTLKKLEDLQKAERLLHPVYRLFQQLKQAKQTRLGSSPSPQLRQLEIQICQQTLDLPFNAQKEQLNQKVLNVMLAQTQERLESAAAQFSIGYVEINAKNFSDSNQQMTKLRQTNDAVQQHLSESIQDFSHRYAQNKRAIEDRAQQITLNSTALEQWAQEQNDLPIWTLFLFDMQWITETVKNLAFDRARAKTQQLFDSLYQRHNYIGFLNQVALLPFLEKFGKHHLRT